MKKFSYNSNTPSLEYKMEVKRKNRNWGKIIYQFIIFIMFFSFAFFLAVRILFSISDGEVSVLHFPVNFPFGVKVDSIYVEEGDTIAIDQALFSYHTASSIERVSNEAELWLLRERITAQQKLDLARIELRKAQKSLSVERDFAKKLLRMVNQNLKSKEEYDIQLYKIKQLSILIEKLKDEVFLYKKELERISQDYSQLIYTYNTDTMRIYGSPINGRVNRILIENKEYVDRLDIMRLLNKHKVNVLAYVELKDMNRYETMDTVTVMFPDYSRSLGVISHIYREAEQLPEDLRTPNDTRFALLKLDPLNEKEKMRWSRLDGSTVKVITSNFKHRFGMVDSFLNKTSLEDKIKDKKDAEDK